MRVVNLLLFLGFFFLAGSGLLMTLRLPHGSGGRLSVLGMGRHEWGDIHLYVALAVLMLTLAHLFLNRAWIKKIATKAKIWPLAPGFAAGLALAVGPLIIPVKEAPAGPLDGSSRGQGYRWDPQGAGTETGKGQHWAFRR